MSPRREWPLLLSAGTAAMFYVFRSSLLGDLDSALWAGCAFLWLFAVILWSALSLED